MPKVTKFLTDGESKLLMDRKRFGVDQEEFMPVNRAKGITSNDQ